MATVGLSARACSGVWGKSNF